MQQPIRIFIAYSRKDIAYLNKLKDVLRPLVSKGAAKIWYDGEIIPGSAWEASIKKNLHEAEIILLLLSTDSLASDYFYDKEVADALERHSKGQCKVVPVIIRDCLWEETDLKELQALPQDAKPIADWQSPDAAYKSIGTGISKLIADIQAQRHKTEEERQREENEKHKKENNKKHFWQQLQAADDLFAQKRYPQALTAYTALQNWGDKTDLHYTDAQPHVIQRLMQCKQAVQYSDLKKQAFALYQQANYKAALQTTEQALQYRPDPDLSNLKKQLDDILTKQTQERTALLKKTGMGAMGVLLLLLLMWGAPKIADMARQQPKVTTTDTTADTTIVPPPITPQDTTTPPQITTNKTTTPTDKATTPTNNKAKQDSTKYATLLQEGNELFVKEKYKEAKAKYEEAAKLQPNNADLKTRIKNCNTKLQTATANTTTTTTTPPAPKPVTPPSTTDPFANQMVQVQGGTFTMGSPASEADRSDDEQQHKVTLSTFKMSRYEVTQAQWKAIMGSNPSNFKGDNLPVENVSWDDIQVFLQKLNARYPPSGGKGGYRLPTEAQWEYAARGGTSTPFHAGNCLSTDQANYNGNYPYQNCAKGQYREKTTPVGSFAPNQYGLYDMHGNVWEWCSDWYDKNYYQNSPANNPTGPSSGPSRVLRGGSWHYFAQYCRVAYRHDITPSYRYGNCGFRLALVP